MNERIKALMGKTLDSEFSHTWDTMTYEGLLQFSEKFAELIVQECANAIVNDSRLNDVRSAANGCVRTIKQHFGVEE
jgi:hypothetical protein